ncbi:MAG TPA: Ig-like domain-containing protein [Solirubrobacteraceae bacterium]|nr:Ig-like domain-containing protein [Solirubrobacteraceae bacterium]
MRALGLTLLALALAAGALPAIAQASPPPVGMPVQLAPPNSCYSTIAAGGCTAFGESQSIFGAEPIAVSGDGLNVYAGGDNGGGVAFSRGAGGALATIGSAGGFADTRFAISGAGLFASVRDTGSNYGEVAALARGAGGTLSFANSIVDNCNVAIEHKLCTNDNGLFDVEGVAVSPDGSHVYAASHFGGAEGTGKTGGALTVFSRNAATQVIAQAQCVPYAATVLGPCKESGSAEGLQGAEGVAVSPDGKFLYATGYFAGAVLGFNIVQSGANVGKIGSLVNCLWGAATNSECTQTAGMGLGKSIALSPDGHDVYVAMFNGDITALRRDPVSGVLSFNQCFTEAGGGGCAADPALIVGARDVAMSPDGRYVYLSGGSGTNGYLRAYARNGLTGQLAPLGCLTYLAIPGCSTAAGLANAEKLAISPDGHNLYLTAFEGGDKNGAVAAFRIQTAPSCQGTNVAVASGTNVSVPLTCTDESGDPITRTIVTAPGKGALGAIDQAAGAVTYTPGAGFTGADGFAFQASDGTNVSATANVSITVTPAPAPVGPSSRILGLLRHMHASKLKSFHGTASGGRPIARVEVALVRLIGRAHVAARGKAKASCLQLNRKGVLVALKISHGRCTPTRFLLARGTSKWTFRLLHRLPRGNYALTSRATDTSGTSERSFSARLGNSAFFSLA